MTLIPESSPSQGLVLGLLLSMNSQQQNGQHPSPWFLLYPSHPVLSEQCALWLDDVDDPC